jgi:hypothetical protein
MTKNEAYTKWKLLQFMTVDRGCAPPGGATAARLAAALAARWGFTEAAQESTRARPDWESRYSRAEAHAARRWHWEYRTCGKRRCRCMRAGLKHGPYRYAKQRKGRQVKSIYLGRK